MATTETILSGDGTTTQFSFTFPYIKTEDVRVELQEFDTVESTVISRVQISSFSILANNPTVIQFAALGAATNYQAITGAPLTNHAVNTSNIIRVRIYRFTSADANPSTFIQGSAVRAQDLNDNFEQILYIMQESENTLQTIQLGGIGENIIGTVSIQDDAITADKLRDSTVTDSDRAVTTNHIRNDAVTTAKIVDNAITTAKIVDNAITTAKIVDDAITTAKIADGTIVNADVNASAAIVATKLSFTQSGTGAVARTVDSKLKDVVSVKDFGAVGDGTTDDTAALQAALNSNKLVFMPPGLYLTTAQLSVNPTVNRNSGFIGGVSSSAYPYLQQSGGPTWDGQQEAIIKYDGAISSTVAVIAASSEAIGTEPAATFDTTLWSLTLENITLDANEKAGYGLFTARVQNLQLDKISARGATIAGVSINGTYSGSIRSIRCSRNSGRGFELGAADERFSWTAQDKVNALYIYDLHAFANGSAATFRESDPVLRKDGCGVYFGPHRSAHIFGVVSENNFGANVVFEPTSVGNTIHGFYTELGCKYAPNGAGTDAISLGYATKQWGVIFVGVSGGASQNNRLVDGICAIDAIWITGTEPTAARRESGFEIYNCSLATGGLTADWANYRLVNCGLELETITGSAPTGAYTIRGGLQFGAGLSQLTAYEEGNFTPTLQGTSTAGTGWSYAVQDGAYTRIGRMVFISGRIALSAVSVDATGPIAIGDLPFTVKNANNFNAPASLARTINLATNVVSLDAAARPNFTQLLLTKRTAASASSSSVVLADLSSTTALDFACSYVVA